MAVARLRNYSIVILDSNALFMPFQFKLNLDSELKRILGEYELVIPSCVRIELESLKASEKFGTLASKLASKIPQPNWYLKFEANQKLVPNANDLINRFERTDNQLIEIAKELDGIVVTNDRKLLKRLHANNITTISLRAKKYLKMNSRFR